MLSALLSSPRSWLPIGRNSSMPITDDDRSLARGVYAALATPCRPESMEPDSAALLDYLDRVSAAHVDGLVLYGSTGEFVHFDTEDRMRTAGLALKRSRLPVLLNISHSTLQGTKKLAGHGVDNGAAGLLVMPPYFYRYNGPEIERFLLQISELVAGQVPLYLYNLPACTSPIPADLVVRLLESGNFAGIKDSSGDWEYFGKLLRLRQTQSFQLLAGNEQILIEALGAGADGVVSGLAAAIPELLVALWTQMQKRSQSLGRSNLKRHLQAFLGWVARFPPTVAIKQAAAFRSWLTPCQAIDLSRESHTELREFEKWLIHSLPPLLAECRTDSAGSADA